MHFYFCNPVDQALVKEHWHKSMHGAIEQANVIGTHSLISTEVIDRWQYHQHVSLGTACHGNNFPACIFRRESSEIAFEDAWVLSRMLENYEEDIDDGLQEYERFRRPRRIKSLADQYQNMQRLTIAKTSKKIARNLNTALSTRFMPEIAMQRIDWLYAHDCIRGFR